MKYEIMMEAIEAAPGACGTTVIDQALDAVREHLGMPVAYLSEFVGGDAIFRHVRAPGLEDLIAPGDSRPLQEIYCRHILSGDLPPLMPDTAAFPLAAAMPITAAVPIGAHVSVPVHRSDGTPFGMFCALSPEPNLDLNDRDLRVVTLFARIAAEQVRDRLEREADLRDATARIDEALDGSAFEMAFQPVYDLARGQLSGFEALCRFTPEPYRPPDIWLAEAQLAGRAEAAELALAAAAIARVPELPEGTRLAVNLSPDVVSCAALRALLEGAPMDRLTIEVTEHVRSSDMAALRRALEGMRGRGALIAVDDVGAGYAGLRQILQLRPDVLKLDRSLVQDIDADPARRSLAAAMVHFATETGARLVAEGIETESERRAVEARGIHYGQGWLFGRPGRMADAPRSLSA